MNISKVLVSILVVANSLQLAGIPAQAAQPGNRDLKCNSGTPLQNTPCNFAKGGIGFGMQGEANKYCARENGNRWFATGLINGKRECKQKAWYQR